jgi:cyclase
MPNRRDFLRALIAAPAGASFLFSQTPAQDPIKATKLSEGLAVLMGDGGNVAVVISDGGLMMVDGGYAERSADLLQAVSTQVDSHPFRMVFNTHWHLDHVGCNETLGKTGAKIVAHANSKKWLSQKVTIEALSRVIEPLKPEGLPTQTFTKGGKLTFGKEKIEYGVVPPAHTDGDAYLFFPGPNVLHTGDLLFNGTYPFIDYSTGGWIGGMASACDTLLKVGDSQTRIIPGHGPMGTKTDLQASRDMLTAVHDRFEAMRKQGKTAKDVAAAAPTKDFDDRFSKGAKPDQFLQIAYTGLLRHYAPSAAAAQQ